MVGTLLMVATTFAGGLACGLWLRYRQRVVLDALLVEATDSVNGTIEAIDALDVDAVTRQQSPRLTRSTKSTCGN